MIDKSVIKKVVLAYSGGLDTSIILKWLQETYACEVVTFTADLGQGEELAPARAKAEMLGIKEIYIEDLREEFVRDYVFPMFRANALYEGVYLLGTSIARPCNRGAQQINALIKRIGAKHREDIIANKFFAQIFNINLFNAQHFGFRPRRRQLFALPEIGGKSDNLASIGLLQPFQND